MMGRIELRDISFSYQGQEEGNLCGVDLKIRGGECVLLCGKSGCGKTTVTRLVNGLIPNFFAGELRGEVEIDHTDVLQMPMYEIAAHVGSVFQNPRTQFFNVDTDSEIAFGIENEALPAEELRGRLDETAAALGIQHLRGRNIFELSGGEKQKIAFASIYAMNPDIYLLDEPSSNLDMEAIRDLKEQLRRIKGQGKTILIAEHRLYYLMDLADKVVYLSQGKIAGIYLPGELRGLSDDRRRAMGLRAVDLRRVQPCVKPEGRGPALLELRNVSLYYKKRRILERVSLTAAKGEIIGIVGHNGAGKTTFSRALCGLHKECEGEFLWNGIRQNAKERRKRSYMVMQDVNYELFAETVEAECRLGIRRPDRGLIERTLAELDLLPYCGRHPNTLSGGQKQRVAVAVSMICGKELLIFDEPTSGLDFDSMEQVSRLIRKLAADKIIFVVTHDYEFICQTCTRLLHFEGGTIAEDLPLSEEAGSRMRRIFGDVF